MIHINVNFMALKGINGTYAAISRNLKLYVWGKNT
jgi:hypothetical protein